MLNLIVLAITLAAAPIASAQGPGPGGAPPQGPPQGGPPQGGFRGGQGGPGMGMRGGMGGGFQILNMPEVQVELKLTDAQKDSIKQLMPQRGPGGPGGGRGGEIGPGGPPPQGGQGGPPQGPPPPGQGQPGQPGQPPQGPPQGGFRGDQGGPDRGQEMDKKLKEILDAGQYNRYHELELQFNGPSAAMRKDVGEKLGITEEQRQAIMEIMQKNRPQPPAPPEPGAEPQRPDPEKMFKEMEARREKINAEIMALFTGEQKSKWAELIGKPFKFNRQPSRFGGGGGGR